MLHHDGSRGKGSRRMPSRDGGARKKRVPTWHKQAAHAVHDIAALSEPTVTLHYLGDHYKNPGERIYVFDQLIAKAGIPYLPRQVGKWQFNITVPAADRNAVMAMIATLEKR